MLGLGGEPNSSDYDSRTPLHIACAEGNMPAVKLLIEGGADLTVQDRWGHTALSEAEDASHVHIIKFLSEQRTTVNSVQRAVNKFEGELDK